MTYYYYLDYNQVNIAPGITIYNKQSIGNSKNKKEQEEAQRETQRHTPVFCE